MIIVNPEHNKREITSIDLWRHIVILSDIAWHLWGSMSNMLSLCGQLPKLPSADPPQCRHRLKMRDNLLNDLSFLTDAGIFSV